MLLIYDFPFNGKIVEKYQNYSQLIMYYNYKHPYTQSQVKIQYFCNFFVSTLNISIYNEISEHTKYCFITNKTIS